MTSTALLRSTKPSSAVGSEVTLKRIINAPRERVFKAWTDPAILKRWWAPKGFTTPFMTVDLKVNGVFHFCMRSPEGRDFWGKGVYRAIIKPELIAYIDSFSDAKGDLVAPEYYGMSAEFPSEAQVMVTFNDLKGRTELILRHAIPESTPERTACAQGWNEMLDRLDEELKGTI